MGTGGIKESQNSLKGVAADQRATGAALGIQGQSLINEGRADQAPLANFLRAITGGNSTATSQALAPVIANITEGTNANKEHIYDQLAPGAARDSLLGQNLRAQGTQVAQATNSTFLNAFPQLAALSQGNINAGLGATGAGITSTGNSASTTGSILSSQEQQKAATLGAFGQLAGAAGGALGGGSLGMIFGKAKLPGGGGGGYANTGNA